MPTKIHPTFKLSVPTQQRSQMVEITKLINAKLKSERLEDGVAVVYSPHTTAGVCINENADPDVQTDVLAKLDALMPKKEAYYQHGEGNSDSHVKAILTGNSVTVLFEDGKLLLGQWQGVYLCEFDGPRERTVWLKVLQDRRHSNERD